MKDRDIVLLYWKWPVSPQGWWQLHVRIQMLRVGECGSGDNKADAPSLSFPPHPPEQLDTLPGPQSSPARAELHHRFFWQEKCMVVCSGEGDWHWLWWCGSQSVWRPSKARRASETQCCLYPRRRLGLGKCKYVLTFRLCGVVAGPGRYMTGLTFLLDKEKGPLDLVPLAVPVIPAIPAKLFIASPPPHFPFLKGSWFGWLVV